MSYIVLIITYYLQIVFRYIEAEKRILLIGLRSEQIASIIKELSKVNRLEDTINGQYQTVSRKIGLNSFLQVTSPKEL